MCPPGWATAVVPLFNSIVGSRILSIPVNRSRLVHLVPQSEQPGRGTLEPLAAAAAADLTAVMARAALQYVAGPSSRIGPHPTEAAVLATIDSAIQAACSAADPKFFFPL
jgi:hypothetical protein